MKNILKFSFVLMLSMFLFSSCGEDEPSLSEVNCTAFAANQDFIDAANELLDASQAYSADQSVANCQAYKSALDRYFDVVEPYVEKCGDDATFAQFKQAIDQYKTLNDQLTCS